MGRLYRYAFLAFVLLILSAVAGAFLPAAMSPVCGQGATSLLAVNVSCLGSSAETWIVRGILLAVLMVLLNKVVVDIACLQNDQQLREQQLTPDGNDSPAILNIGIFVAVAILLMTVPYTALLNYVDNVVFRGSLAFLLAYPIAVVLLRWRCGITSYEQYQKSITLPQTNGAALWTAGAMLLAVLLI